MSRNVTRFCKHKFHQIRSQKFTYVEISFAHIFFPFWYLIFSSYCNFCWQLLLDWKRPLITFPSWWIFHKATDEQCFNFQRLRIISNIFMDPSSFSYNIVFSYGNFLCFFVRTTIDIFGAGGIQDLIIGLWILITDANPNVHKPFCMNVKLVIFLFVHRGPWEE